ncbi:phosphate ABC transporter substrate-binding protein PstS [Tsuneonella sp. CC-YZS046]|uniref:phosphate ABC transporter substrate-binding protein PstS n=1 Tax=Tsuneonella sp. CC-YZS046 TaxID=3042152 RepID=UPI002D7A3374|nr:phosphate ABC transporter substrate-binding protein PstS [Tsuneonella sp. CC-YZS046]WRO67403.1 phosphate ABC transporter substrate-binding protein PstS [Tsuneonella sp. CC-YZS046]
MLTSSPDGVPVLESRTLVRRRFVMALGVAVVVAAVALLLVRSGVNDRILGSGSTAAQPLIQRVAVDFQNARSGDQDWISGSAGVEYEPVGSLGGVMRLDDPEVDFAVTDYPLSSEALQQRDAVQFPIVVGSISVAYNLEQPTPQPLRFGSKTLAGIFSGRIVSWADPAIAADNPGVSLPATAITVVYRSDGSGSTYNWSSYLSRVDADWKSGIGTGTTLKWPVGTGIKGSSDMAKAIGATQGTIGYLDSGQAKRAGLSVGLVQNDAGQFVAATEANVIAARGNPAAANAYPVVAASYVIMKRTNASSNDNERTLRFLSFLLDHSAEAARSLGYLPLADRDIAEVRQIWSRELNYTAPSKAPAAN